jgi:hypothetical protein
MAHPKNRLPDIENERIILEALRRFRLETIPLSQIEGGSAGAGSGGAIANYTPTFVPEGQSFTVPANTQVLFAVPIDVEGNLIIEGVLVEVN